MTIIEFFKVFARSAPILFGIMVLIFVGIIAGMIYEELTK
jgi:tetrahydromethanopterin S-methyltransferase subunit F